MSFGFQKVLINISKTPIPLQYPLRNLRYYALHLKGDGSRRTGVLLGNTQKSKTSRLYTNKNIVSRVLSYTFIVKIS